MKTRRSVMRAERGYSNIDYMKKNFSSIVLLLNLLSTSVTNLGLMVFFQELIYLE